MNQREDPSGDVDVAYVLIEELLRTSFVLSEMIGSLLEGLPDETFHGDDKAGALIGLVVGSCRPAVEAAGETECWTATALIAAIRDRALDDLHAAARMTEPDA